MSKIIDNHEELISKLTEALKFYGDEQRHNFYIMSDKRKELLKDAGQKARDALALVGEV